MVVAEEKAKGMNQGEDFFFFNACCQSIQPVGWEIGFSGKPVVCATDHTMSDGVHHPHSKGYWRDQSAVGCRGGIPWVEDRTEGAWKPEGAGTACAVDAEQSHVAPCDSTCLLSNLVSHVHGHRSPQPGPSGASVAEAC